MTRKIKTTLLTGLLFFGLLTGLQAQDKYEYAIVMFRVDGANRTLVITDAKGEKDTNVERGASGRVELIKKVNEMSEEGWSAYQNETIGLSLVYYLKRKKS